MVLVKRKWTNDSTNYKRNYKKYSGLDGESLSIIAFLGRILKTMLRVKITTQN